MCGLVLCGSSAGQSRRKNGLPHPGREPRGYLHAGGEKRGYLAAPGRQTKWGGYIAKGLPHLKLVRLVTGEPRRHLEHKISLHKAASEVRYIAISNNGSTTERNGVSKLGLRHTGPHCLLLSTLRLKSLEKKQGRGWDAVPPCHPLSLPDSRSRLQSLSRTTNSAARKCCLLVTCRHTRKKQGAARSLLLAFDF
jgi:hypothetical protein